VEGNDISAGRVSNTGSGNITITGDAWNTLNLHPTAHPAISANGNIEINSFVYSSTTAPNTPAIVSNAGSVTIIGRAGVVARTLTGSAPAIRAATNIGISTSFVVEAQSNTGNTLEAPSISITNGTTGLIHSSGGAAFSVANPAISGANTRVRVNHIQIFPVVPPTIRGPTALTLLEGYAATSTGAFIITSVPAVTVSIDNNHGGRITWHNTHNRLYIGEGLTGGIYPVVLTVSNGALTNAVLTFTLTVSATPIPVIDIITHPADTTVMHGSITGSLDVYASITPNQGLTPLWHRNTTNSNTGGTSVGFTGTSFPIPTDLALGTHYFYVVVSSPGATPVPSSVARVTVNDAFVPVTNITGVPATVLAGTPLTLSGFVAPFYATNRDITWSLLNAGTTGATISGNTFNAAATGEAVVRATITNGRDGFDFTQDFTITVTVTQDNDGGNNNQQPGGNDNDTQQPGGNDNDTQQPGGNDNDNQQPGGNNDNQQPGGNNDGGGGGGGCSISAGLFAMLFALPLVFKRKK